VLAQPTGTLTFLFTDIEGSTRLWDQAPALMQTALGRHDAIMRDAIIAAGGMVFKTVGDAFHAAFPTARGALSAAIAAQSRLIDEDWGDLGSLRVRMALDTGVAEARDGDYFGAVLNRLARIRDAAYGQQILVSRATAELLRDELGEETELLDAGEHSLRGIQAPERIFQVVHAGLPHQFPPIRTQASHVLHLPAYLNEFVGRSALLEQLRALLLEGEHRLLTLVGPAGTGKTRLAVHVASTANEPFDDGVFFVPLSGVTDPNHVPGAIADALGVPQASARSPIQAVVRHLQERKVLLVIDNFEQVLEAAPCIGEVLRSTPTTVIVTSRSLLGVYGERAFEVPTLALPADGATPAPESLRQNEAVALFVTRARASDPAFELTPENGVALANICRRLDGLPLAIELAAARVKLLTPEALLQRLDQRFTILTGGARDMDERQRTLRAAIDWSHNLLTGDERALFRRLAVLRGGTLEAIEAICGEGLRTPVIDLVASLCDKSLLRHIDPTSASGRLTMLETIREYAAERLEDSEDREVIEARHAEYFAALSETLGGRLLGPRQVESIRSLEEEQENIRAAFARFEARRDGPGMVRIAQSLWRFWEIHGDFTEGRRCLRLAIQSAEGLPDPEAVEGRLLQGCGLLAIGQGEVEEAQQLLRRSVECARRAGDLSSSGRALTALAVAVWRAGDLPEATRCFEESRADLLRTDDTWGTAASEHFLGHILFDHGEHARAGELWEQSLARFREIGDRWSMAQPLKDLGLLKSRAGDLQGARRLYDESLANLRETHDLSHVADLFGRLGEMELFEGNLEEALSHFDNELRLFRQLGDRSAVALSLNRSAEAAALHEDIERARSLYEESLAIAREIKNRRLTAGLLHNLGNIALMAGQVERAVALFGESLSIHRELGREGGIADALEGLAETRAAAGDTIEGARLFGLASALREKAGIHADPLDRIEHSAGRRERLQALRRALGDQPFAAALAEGTALNLDDVVPLPASGS
jgi:predicted ATPase/class 3 adenylate cyclase